MVVTPMGFDSAFGRESFEPLVKARVAAEARYRPDFDVPRQRLVLLHPNRGARRLCEAHVHRDVASATFPYGAAGFYWIVMSIFTRPGAGVDAAVSGLKGLASGTKLGVSAIGIR